MEEETETISLAWLTSIISIARTTTRISHVVNIRIWGGSCNQWQNAALQRQNRNPHGRSKWFTLSEPIEDFVYIRLFRQVTDFQSFLRSKPHIDQQILDRLPSSKQRLRSSTSVNLRPMPKHLTPLAPRCRSQSWTQSPRTLDSDSESTSTFYKYRIYQNM
jgi:hypothetical protein